MEIGDMILDRISMINSRLYKDMIDFIKLGYGEWMIVTDAEERYIYNEWRDSIRLVRNFDEEVYRLEFGRRFRTILYYSGLTQMELSEKTGIAQYLISNYMNGKTLPTMYNFHKLCKAMKCSIADYDYIMNETRNREIYIY